MSVGTNIKNERTKRRFTQAEFAQRMGVSLRAVQLWEADQRQPRPPAVRALAELTGRPFEDFEAAEAVA